MQVPSAKGAFMTVSVSLMMQEIRVMKNYYCQLFRARTCRNIGLFII